MKNLLISLGLLFVLLGFGSFVFMDTAAAQKDLVPALLNLPAPPPPNPLRPSVELRERDEAFYNKKTPPDDDAPIEDLLDYWRNQSAAYQELGYNIKPSEKVLERLLAEVDKDPKNISGMLNILPENQDSADLVKRIYDSMPAEDEEGNDPRGDLRGWLKYRSSYFSDELAETSRSVGDADEYVTNQDELLALTRVDFSKAQPILNRLYSDTTQPVSQTLAKWALYRHAIATDSLGDIERYRDELKAVVEDKTASPGQRDLALDALVKEIDWSGRDDWYYGLLGDETLADLRVKGRTFTGLTTIIYHAPPEKYADKMLELLKSSNPTIRSAAVRNLALLINKNNPEIIEALLPWLENPNWAKEVGGERGRIVDALANFSLPASVPGLLEALEEKQTRMVPIGDLSANSNSPTRLGNSNSASGTVTLTSLDTYPLRSSAISALAAQKDPRAVPALRRVINDVEEYERQGVVRAILLSKGYTIPEQVDSLEFTVRQAAQEERNLGSNSNTYAYATKAYAAEDAAPPPPRAFSGAIPTSYTAAANVSSGPYAKTAVSGDEIRRMLGNLLIETQDAEEPLVNAVLDRITALERRDPPTSEALRKVLQSWNGPAINAMMLRDLKNGKATVDTVVKLLSLRKVIFEKQKDVIYDARGGGAFALGITACMLNDTGLYHDILDGESAEQKAAMLSCARMVRANLDVSKIAALLGGANKTLALAAERYLESNDSPEARAAVLALHPNEARIMGATNFFAPGEESLTESAFIADLFNSLPGANFTYPFFLTSDHGRELRVTEKRIKKEVLENTELLGVYAYDDNFIRIFKDRAVFSWEEDPARYNERTLEADEFERFKSLLAASYVDQMAPYISEPGDHDEEGRAVELLMVGRQGGRRVYLQGGETPEFFKRLDREFEDLRKPPAKLRYWLEKDVPGLRILFADKDLAAKTVWKNGDDLRLLIEDEALREQIEKELDEQAQAEATAENYDYEKGYEVNQKRRAARAFDHISWRKLVNEKVAELTTQPPGIEAVPQRDNNAVASSPGAWKARAGNIEIRADQNGLYKVVRGQLTRIREGFYDEPLITANGRWAIATSYSEGSKLVRVNMTNNREFPIAIPESISWAAQANVPGINRVLLRGSEFSGHDGEEAPSSTTYMFLDPETGVAEPVRGEVRPLSQLTIRALQATATPDDFWAAIPEEGRKETVLGLYNMKTLTFKPMQRIPRILFNSMDMWVDEKEKTIYLVYMGHLLSIPLNTV